MPDTLRGATILNVDDDPRARYLVSRILEYAGATVVEAGSGEAALEAVARQPVDIVLRAGETRYRIEEQMQAANGEGLVFETLHRRRDGSAFPVEVSSRGTDLDGERVLLSIIRDITERKQAEQEREGLPAELGRQARLLDTLVEKTDAWLAYLDPENRLVWANSHFASAVGADREEIIGRPLEEVLPADGTLARLLQRAESTGEPARLHAIPKRLRGARRNLDLAALPVRNRSGAAQGTVFSARDVTVLVTALVVDQYRGEFTLRSDDGGTVAEARVDLASLE